MCFPSSFMVDVEERDARNRAQRHCADRDPIMGASRAKPRLRRLSNEEYSLLYQTIARYQLIVSGCIA